MADDLQDFLEKQGIVIDTLKHVIINCKKLPKANVTLTKTREHAWLIYRSIGRRFKTYTLGSAAQRRRKAGRSCPTSSKMNS
jgi:hypothetical protein